MDENHALSILVVGLKTRRRPVDLLTVGRAIEFLTRKLGSTAEVARRAQVTPSMVNRFRAVEHLGPKTRDLVRRRLIDRVSDVHQLARIKHPKLQVKLARIALDRALSTKELRDVVTILLRSKSTDVQSVVDRVVSSRKRLEHVYAVGTPLPLGFETQKGEPRKRILRALKAHGISAHGIGPIIQHTAMLFLTDQEYRRVESISRKSGDDVSTTLSRCLGG